MDDLRQSHQCHRDNCDSAATSAVDLHVVCRAPGGIGHLVKMRCTIKVCDKHRDDVRPYVLSDENRESIRTGLMESGFPEPDFLSARIEFVPIVAEPVAVVKPRFVDKVMACDRGGCAHPARWQIKQLFWHMANRGRGPHAIELLSNLYVCEAHRKETKPEHLLMDDDREQTRHLLVRRGLLLPDMDRMKLEFVPLVVAPQT